MRVFILLVLCSISLSLVWSQGSCPRCTPLCRNGDGSTKVCGNDGCGGSCGTCASGQACCQGVCVCQPNCVGRNCGDDGCGGESCGKCSSTQTCVNGQCSGTPTVSCNGRVCGNNRAGGSCGSCPTGQRCREGQCECFYDCNERNCGNAVQELGVNTAVCPQRVCGTCPSGYTCGSNGLCSALTPCSITLRVLDCSTNVPVTVTSTVAISSSSLSYSATVTIPGSGTGSWSSPGTGSFTFQITASGYNSKTETHSVTSSTTSIDLCVNRPIVTITVVDCTSLSGLSVTSSVTISSTTTGYSTSLSVSPSGSASWTIPGSGSFTFQTVASGYPTKTEVRTVTETTTSIQLCLQRNLITVRVLDCSNNVQLTTTSTVVISSGSYSTTLTIASSSSASWGGAGFYGNFNFQTTASGYETKTEVRSVTETTTSIDICLNRVVIQIDIQDRATLQTIAPIQSTISWTVQGTGGSGSMNWSGITTWNGVATSGYGSYTFTAIPSASYSQGNLTISVSASTRLIVIYVDKLSFCGDLVCTSSDWAGSRGTRNSCPMDCTTIFFWLERADFVQGVHSSQIRFYEEDPRTYSDSVNGPNKKQNLEYTQVTLPDNQFSIYVYSFGFEEGMVYFEIITQGYISFYWSINTFDNPRNTTAYWYIRAHLSPLLEADNTLNYRIVNSWWPDSAGFNAPTTLYTVLFWPSTSLNGFDASQKEVKNSNGQLVGKMIAASLQSGGPNTFDINPNFGDKITIWNVKPNRPSSSASLQNRPLATSGSYYTIYGRTPNAPNGKQLDLWAIWNSAGYTTSTSGNLWYAGTFTSTVNSTQGMPTLQSVKTFHTAPGEDTGNDLYMNCLDYGHCANYLVPAGGAK